MNTDLQIPLASNLTYHLNFGGIGRKDCLDEFQTNCHPGQFAYLSEESAGVYQAVRDPLGIGKLFYTESDQGELYFSDKFVELYQYNTPIYSVPPGRWVRIGTGNQREVIRDIAIPKKINDSLELDSFGIKDDPAVLSYQQTIDKRLDRVFNKLHELENQGWKIFIALSGGLDSTIIAQKAAQHLDAPVATTLDLGKSEDSEKSQKIAEYLKLNQLVFETTEEQILDALKMAPALCQDFRDFNVHCAALNILLAQRVSNFVASESSIDADKVIILTGDLMNEFTCDYAGEVIDGVEYYKLPRAGKKKVLQKHLIKGLDTSDRELSVFESYGLHCIQPYACLYDLYESIPESVFHHEDPKKVLNSFCVDQAILDFIPKEKLRAQVGSRENMGILGLCHRQGFTDETYRQQLLGDCGFPDAKVPIFIGRYDMESFSS